jgi:phage replication O-like protein O
MAASPQKENGYTAIANKIMEALAIIRIPGEARQVLDAIFRKTYGWNKKEDRISLSQLRKMTGLKDHYVIRARKRLTLMNLITIKKDHEGSVIYKFQKDYTKWRPLPKAVVPPTKNGSPYQKGKSATTKKGNRPLPKRVVTKDTITKDTITKTRGIDFTKEMFQLFEKEFEKYWNEYDPRGKKNKVYAKKRFMALCRTGKLPEFEKGYDGYSNYLKHQRNVEGFDQRPKHFSTLVSDYEEYIGFEYKPPM